MEFGEKLRELRTQHNMSQQQLAEKLKITPRTVRGWEQEGRVPRQEWIYYSLSDLFGCPRNHIQPDKQDLSCHPVPLSISETADAKKSLTTTKLIFAEQRISEQEQQAFLIDLMQIYLSVAQKNHNIENS